MERLTPNYMHQVGEIVQFGGGSFRVIQISERAKDGSRKVVLQEIVDHQASLLPESE